MITLKENQVILIDVIKNIRAQLSRLPFSDKFKLELECSRMESTLAREVSDQLIEKLTGK